VRRQAQKAMEDLSRFSTEMSTSIQSDGATRTLTANDIELEKLCSQCSVLADNMIDQLKTFELSGGYHQAGNVWVSVFQVLRSMWSAKDLEDMEKNLNRYRDSMNTRMIASLRYVLCKDY
jgi:hypothetical protein